MRQPALREKLDGRILQAAFGDAEFQAAHCCFPLSARSLAGFPYKFFGRDHALFNHLRFAIPSDLAEEAAPVAFVAHGAAFKLRANQAAHRGRNRRAIRAAKVSGRSSRPCVQSFLRERLIERHKPGLLRLRERFAVHEAQHQHFAVLGVLHDCRDQPVFLLEIEFHFVSRKTKSPPALAAPAG